MKFNILINTTPFELSTIKRFYRKSGMELRNMGYYYPNAYIIAKKNRNNHNWLLFSNNLKHGTTQLFIDRCIEMNGMGKSVLLDLDFNTMDTSIEVFEYKTLSLIRKIRARSAKINLYCFEVEGCEGIQNDKKIDLNKLQKMVDMSFKINLSDFSNDILSLKNIYPENIFEPFSKAFYKDFGYISLLSDSKFSELLTVVKKHHNSIAKHRNYYNFIKSLVDDGFFAAFENYNKQEPSKHLDEAEISKFINWWNFFK